MFLELLGKLLGIPGLAHRSKDAPGRNPVDQGSYHISLEPCPATLSNWNATAKEPGLYHVNTKDVSPVHRPGNSPLVKDRMALPKRR